MIQKITQNNGNFWTVNLIMRAKIVNQSSDFPVRRTGSYRHKKSTGNNSLLTTALLTGTADIGAVGSFQCASWNVTDLVLIANEIQ